MIALRVLAVTGDVGVCALVRDVFRRAGDTVTALSELRAGISVAEVEPMDLVFVDVGLGEGAALALVHHVKAMNAGAEVVAMARPASLEAAAHAISLGAGAVVMLPPSGDELLSAATVVRSRRAAQRELEAMRRGREDARMMLACAERIAQLVGEPDKNLAFAGLVETLKQAAGAGSGALYVPVPGGSTIECQATAGVFAELPASITDGTELARAASERGFSVMDLSLSGVSRGRVVVDRLVAREGLPSLLTQAAATLYALAERRSPDDGPGDSLKDRDTSAYTFAYFADLAGREIDKAARHGRRFALATVAPSGDAAPKASPLDVSEALLTALRDSDVLARVDGHEFYVLLPETTGTKAHRTREKLRESEIVSFGLSVGVATYPHDGQNLLALLRAAKRRADAWAGSIVERLRLHRLSLSEIVDALTWDQGGAGGDPWTAPTALDVSRTELFSLTRTAVTHAAHAGDVLAAVTASDGVGVSSAVRSHPSTQAEGTHVTYDVRHRDACEDVEVMCLFAEHGTFVVAGRASSDRFVGIESADPRLADLLLSRLGELTGRGAPWVDR